jgi:uncharacterized membrane protein YidH (DUF202 family)
MKSKLGIMLSSATMVLPLAALAQTINATNAGSFIATAMDFINLRIIPLLIGLAVLWFMYGVFTYVRAAGDEEKRKEGRSMMVYGIIAIAVMLSVIGLVNLVVNSFGWGGTTLPPVRI